MPTFPQAYISGVTRWLQSAVMTTESPFSFVQQTQDAGGERWVVGIDCTVEGLAFEAFANSVINKKRPFDLRMPKAGRLALANVSLTVDGASQTGNALNVRGNWSGQSLQAGDFISLGWAGAWRLHQLTEDASPNGTGRATLQIIPKLRTSPANAASVEVYAPHITLRATGPAPASIGYRTHQFTINAVEAL